MSKIKGGIIDLMNITQLDYCTMQLEIFDVIVIIPYSRNVESARVMVRGVCVFILF